MELSGLAGPRAVEYRRLSSRLRVLANEARFPETRLQLQAIADGFNRLARHVEARDAARIADHD
jgi:hypothetical protein